MYLYRVTKNQRRSAQFSSPQDCFHVLEGPVCRGPSPHAKTLLRDVLACRQRGGVCVTGRWKGWPQNQHGREDDGTWGRAGEHKKGPRCWFLVCGWFEPCNFSKNREGGLSAYVLMKSASMMSKANPKTDMMMYSVGSSPSFRNPPAPRAVQLALGQWWRQIRFQLGVGHRAHDAPPRGPSVRVVNLQRDQATAGSRKMPARKTSL